MLDESLCSSTFSLTPPLTERQRDWGELSRHVGKLRLPDRQEWCAPDELLEAFDAAMVAVAHLELAALRFDAECRFRQAQAALKRAEENLTALRERKVVDS